MLKMSYVRSVAALRDYRASTPQFNSSVLLYGSLPDLIITRAPAEVVHYLSQQRTPNPTWDSRLQRKVNRVANVAQSRR